MQRNRDESAEHPMGGDELCGGLCGVDTPKAKVLETEQAAGNVAHGGMCSQKGAGAWQRHRQRTQGKFGAAKRAAERGGELRSADIPRAYVLETEQ
jgi:hypothetical protein